jgi:hypothetical protein
MKNSGNNYTARSSKSTLSGFNPSNLNLDGYSPRSIAGGVPPVQDDTIFPLGRFDFSKGKLRWGGSWVAHRPHKYKVLWGFGPPYFNYTAIFMSDITDEEKAELIRFLLTLELWETTPGEKAITSQEIWLKSLINGPDFTKELDDLFSLTWRKEEKESYNFVFPSRFMPRWEEETNDLDLCLEKTYSNEDVLDEFSYTLDSLLREVKEQVENIVLPSDAEILFDRSTTTSYISEEERRLPHWEASFLKPMFNDREIRSTRCVVPVYPGGVRDTIIADISANNSIRWLERSLRHILQYVPESAVTLHSSTFRKRLDDVVHTKGFHVLRDIKKCGITYNVRDIFPVVRECLEKNFYDVRWRTLHIINNLFIKECETQVQAQRGYGLGMANHIVTLCNIVIHRMCRNALRLRGTPIHGKAILGNDDADVVFYSKNRSLSKIVASEYLELEHEIHGALGNLTNFKKSVIKPYGLFYETYDKTGWKDKESLVCNAIACAYLAPNIRTAKHYVFSQSDRFTSVWSRRRLRALAAYWGGEFFDFRTELQIHFEAGGWLNTTSLGLKTTLCDIERLSRKFDIRLISYAVNLCKEYMTPPRPLFSKDGAVSNFRYFGPATKSSPKIQLYTLADEDLKVYYKKLTSFQRNYSKRIDKFSSRVKAKSLKNELVSIQKSLLSREPWYTIPKNLVEREDIWFDSLSLEYLNEYSNDDFDPVTQAIIDLYSGKIIEDNYPQLRWDPNIPLEAMKYIVTCDYVHQFTASQFSNMGFLPILEYYLREESIPICRIISECKWHWDIKPSMKLQSSLSRFTIQKEGTLELNLHDDYSPGELKPIGSQIIIEEIERYKESRRPPVKTEDLEKLDKLVEAMQEMHNDRSTLMAAVLSSYRKDEEEDIDVLADGEIDLDDIFG